MGILWFPVLGWAASCSEGFVTCFLKVPLACLGSMAAAVQPNSLGTLRKHFTKPSEQVAASPAVLKRRILRPEIYAGAPAEAPAGAPR